MKNLLLFLLIPSLAFCQVKTNSKPASFAKQNTSSKAKTSEGFTVSGTIQGLADGEVKLTTTQGNKPVANGVAKNGVFSLTGVLNEPTLLWLTVGKEQPRYFYLENADVKITGNVNDVKALKIEGSASHKDFMEFEQVFNPLFGNLNILVADINQAPEAKKPAIMEKYAAAVVDLNKAVSKFVSAKKSSYVSLFVLQVTRAANENVMEVEEHFNMLDEKIRLSEVGKELASYIDFTKVGAIGTTALEFTQNDITDKPVSLSSFKGKYVLIDFWASWCKPCRSENPNVVKVYNKFKDKNFTVLGVSLDQQKEAWVKAIEKDNLKWTNVSDLQLWNNAAAQLYKVQSIPQNFLIDPSGKIVAKDLRGEDLEKKLCEYLGCSN